MNSPKNEQQGTFNTLINNAAWIITALLSLLLLSAFLKHEPMPARHGILLLLTWGIHTLRHTQALANNKTTMLLLAILQLTNLVVATISFLMIFIR